MIKIKNSFFLFLALTICSAYSQNSNSWINYTQSYFKFPITSAGVYRIDASILASRFNLNTTNPKNFQLFFGGKEQYLYIEGEQDNQLNTGDYIEFYLDPTQLRIDSGIYTNIKYLPNPYKNIFNDTVYAFLTLNNSTTNKRFSLEIDTTWANYAAANYIYKTHTYAPTNAYNFVKAYPFGASDSRYTQNEGYGYNFAKGISMTANFGNLNVYTTTPLPCYFQVVYSGNSKEATGQADHQIQTFYVNQNNNQVTIKDTTFFGYVAARHSFSLSNSSLGNNSSFGIISVANPSFSFDNATMLHYLNVTLPQQLNFNNVTNNKFIVPANSNQAKSSYTFTGFSALPTETVFIYNLTTGKKIQTVVSGLGIKAIIPNTSLASECLIVKSNLFTPITNLQTLFNGSQFTNYLNSSTNKSFVLIYHDVTKIAAQQYKAYRQSVAGGGYNVIDANIDELYEQFAFGNNKNPLAIKYFLRYLVTASSKVPSYVFLLGKGIKNEDLQAAYQSQNFIPTMGIPSSDVLLSVQISTNATSALVPEIPIGRFPAIDNTEALNYLTKVQQHEATGNEEWKKNVLHFVGGNDVNLNNVLENYMNNYETLIEDTLYGGRVHTFKKNTTAPIQTLVSDSIKNLISNGASLITFFGHGSEQNFDQAIDEPNEYNNAGRYPLFVANSCESGNIFVFGRRSVSERFTTANQKGSIGFLASVTKGFVYTLNHYTNFFYKALSYQKYNQGIGDVIKETIKNATVINDSLTRFTALEMVLNGDPAIKISPGALPDFAIKNSDVIINSKTYADSIGISLKIKNLGKAVVDSFFVKVTRTFPNNDSLIIFKKIKAPFFSDSLKFYTATDFNRGIGLNKFKVVIDNFNTITETTKMNNSTIGSVDYFINGGDIIPVYPYKYAVVEKTATITLKASTSDPFAPLTTYKLQVDTCDKFSQPIYTALKTSKGGVMEWNINLPFKDSTVYFWRVSRDSLNPQTPFTWRESSFQTIGNKRGWGQAHFHQFKNNTYQFVNYKKDLRKFIFENTKHAIKCRNGFPPYLEGTSISWFYNNITMSNWSCAPYGWNFALFDSISGIPHEVVDVNGPSPGPQNNCVCVNYPIYMYSFGDGDYCGSTNWKTSMEAFLNNIPSNTPVLAWTVMDGQKASFSNTLFNKFDQIGAVNIRNVKDTVPYILFGKKGMSAGQGNEVVGANSTNVVTLMDSIQTKWNAGYIVSEIIGPSNKWNSLHWNVKSLDALPGDTTILKLIGIKTNGQIDTLATFKQDSSDVLALYNYANATTHPFLKLIAFQKDNTNRTAPQLKRWQVLYDEAPECAINPLKGFESINDTLEEGDFVTFKFPIENIGVKPFNDSLVVAYWLEDNNRVKIPLQQKIKKKNFLPGEVLIDTVKINSYQIVGNNIFWIYVNPLNNVRYQKEQQQFNNIGRFSFKVNKDITNPLLDVTFDGVRILNGDIVSAKPHIQITLKDENKFLALNDTSAFKVYLQAPNNNQQQLFFAKELQFTPASLPKNSCSILYNPTLPVDGRYSLLVKARDVSNNKSSSTEYKIQFEIENKPTITNVLNYPNPFSTNTKFVFTLTGSEVPEIFTIQIMTITGKVVREITKEELGVLRIGRNITEYGWDGRDNYGDRLANGVYLYKIITKLNGNAIEKNATEADKFFVKEFGKMVLMK